MNRYEKMMSRRKPAVKKEREIVLHLGHRPLEPSGIVLVADTDRGSRRFRESRNRKLVVGFGGIEYHFNKRGKLTGRQPARSAQVPPVPAPLA